MSGTDSFSGAEDEAGTAPSPSTPQAPARPTRGIDPPSSGNGPPPPPDFGIVAKRRGLAPRAGVDGAARPAPRPEAAPQPTSRPWAIVAVVAAIVAVLAFVLGLVVIGVGTVLSLPSDSDESAPSSEVGDSGPSDPNQNPIFPGTDSGPVESTLQAKIDEYKSARDSGTLWSTIPDTEYNRTALSAFLYLLTDLKLAASFGADTSDYLDQADELERKLLNEEPLGSDISIKLSDRTFTYDGDTGEGGYTAN